MIRRHRPALLLLLLLLVGCVSRTPTAKPGSVQRVAEVLAYRQEVVETVKRRWAPPQGGPERVAVVVFGIDRDGSIGNVKLLESSGDPNFDASAVHAVTRTQRVQAPPRDFLEDAGRIEMYFQSN